MVIPRVRSTLPRLLADLRTAHRVVESDGAELIVPGASWILRPVAHHWLLLGINPLTVVSDSRAPP
jgi:hypothetical protein